MFEPTQHKTTIPTKVNEADIVETKDLHPMFQANRITIYICKKCKHNQLTFGLTYGENFICCNCLVGRLTGILKITVRDRK